MSTNQFIPAHIDAFVVDTISRETPLQKRLRAETAKMPMFQMQISADEGAFLAFLVKMTGAKRVIEIGTFTGYSALAMALAMPGDGRIVACDVSEEWTSIARRYWQEAGVADKIDLRIAPALETMNQLAGQGAAGTFDLAFIDADKANYDGYYESCLALVRSGGLIVLDNMLWGGAVADENDQDKQTQVLRALNLKLRDDARVDISLLTIADGVMLARKK